jgi:hypothetical protein
MQEATYYRKHAERAQRLAGGLGPDNVADAQAHTEWLACELSDYMSGPKLPWHSKTQKKRKRTNQALRAE